MVITHAPTIPWRLPNVQRWSGKTELAPITPPVIVCVVLTGTPKAVARKSVP